MHIWVDADACPADIPLAADVIAKGGAGERMSPRSAVAGLAAALHAPASVFFRIATHSS